jgi:hypothetical protein
VNMLEHGGIVVKFAWRLPERGEVKGSGKGGLPRRFEHDRNPDRF